MFSDEHYVPTLDQMDAVLSFLPVFEQNDFEPSRVEAPRGEFPYHVHARELSQFVRAVYESGFAFEFDWPAWQEDARRYCDEPELLGTADLKVLRKLITLHVRKERFLEGHLPGMVRTGHIVAWLRRLKALRESIASS